jgi:exosortase A
VTVALALGPQASKSSQAPALSPGWPFLVVLMATAFFWLLAWYGDTLRSMIETWVHSETFAHGFLIVPISLWMIWRKRHVIAALNPQPNFWMLLPLAFLGFCWLLGSLAAVVVVQQYCLVLMILFLAATLLGNQIVKELAFPLLFLLFAVPFGEFMLPALMESTADVAIFALRLSGIPVYREGLFFTIPSGNWSVVEACSGLRYLIASITLGFLYAYLTYRSFKRRAAFLLMSISVPLVANWLRAYMIVMIGHLSSMKLATGVDRIVLA